MRILFICTAHNSLSQRLALHLKSLGHAVTVELSLSPDLMIEAAELAQPDLIVCPFLTKRVPKEVYTKYMTLIVHPGPPGDAGPSSLDLALIGDSGELPSWEEQLSLIDFRQGAASTTALEDLGRRTHWGVTVLQAIEKLDGGPIWAFEQFPLAGTPSAKLTKSELYRGPVSKAAVSAVQCALDRLSLAHAASLEGLQEGATKISPSLSPPPSASKLSVTTSQSFLGGKTHERPLLKASQRDFLPILPSVRLQAPSLHLSSGLNPRPALNANVVVQRINSGDSQPGVLSSLFGAPLFLYGAKVQSASLSSDIASKLEEAVQSDSVGQILATRQNAVLVHCGCNFPIWIESVRKPKAKQDKYLSVKLPAQIGLEGVGTLKSKLEGVQEWDDEDGSWSKREGTYQQVWIDYEETQAGDKIAYVYFEFYNGATSTDQSKLLSSAINHALAQPKIVALVLMGGSGYFSNGIALNVIEGHNDPAAESWANINAIDDCVRPLLCPSGVLTIAALRGNAAAGGLALASCCDVVLSSKNATLNPHYRALGLTGSEYHSWSWPARCGSSEAASFMRNMLPMSAEEGLHIGLVDGLVQGEDAQDLDREIRSSVQQIMNAPSRASLTNGLENASAKWTKSLICDSDQNLKYAEQLLANKEAYLTYYFTPKTQVQPVDKKQKRMTISIDFDAEFAKFRHAELEGMRLDFFHPVRSERYSSRRVAFVRKLTPTSTPLRFALHRRYGSNWAEVCRGGSNPPSDEIHQDEEELDSFDSIGNVPDSEAVVRMPEVQRKEVIPESPAHLVRPSPSEAMMSRSESGATVPTLNFSASGSVSRPSTAGTSPVASRRPSLSEFKSLEQEVAEENSRLEVAAATPPTYPSSSPRPSAITFASTSQAQSRTSIVVLDSTSSSTTPSRSQALKAGVEPSHRFTRMKSIPWFRKGTDKERSDSQEEDQLKKKRSTTLRFFDTIGKKGKALVKSNNLPNVVNSEKPLQRRRSMTEAASTFSDEAAVAVALNRRSIGNLTESKTQTLGRMTSRKQSRPASTNTAAPEHDFACYYNEDGTSCVKSQ